MTRRIQELADRLEERGIDVSDLRDLQQELDVVERPGALRRLSDRARELARRQWSHVVGEVRESRELLAHVSKRVRSREALSPEEADHVKAQLADLLRMVPASVIAATNYSLPLPGTSFLTPVLLRKLGLMPSRWREAHLLGELQARSAALRAEGRAGAAAEIDALAERIGEEADLREEMEREALLLTHWDLDGNGVLDATERDAYLAELARVKGLAQQHAARKRWYLSLDGRVFGPMRLSEVGDLIELGPLLACFDGATGWVELEALMLP